MTGSILDTFYTKNSELVTIKESVLAEIDSILGSRSDIENYSVNFSSSEFFQIVLVVTEYLPNSLLSELNEYLGKEPNFYFAKNEVELRYMYE